MSLKYYTIRVICAQSSSLKDLILHYEQKFSHQVDSSGIKSFLTIAGDIMDGPVKVTQGQQSSIVHRRNIDLLKSLRHPRHFGRHYSRQSATRWQANAMILDMTQRIGKKAVPKQKESYLVLENRFAYRRDLCGGSLSLYHLYHADCLEHRADREMDKDPPVICLGLVSQVVDASVELRFEIRSALFVPGNEY
ncbi:hypothetical protein HAX54_048905 [Datura stramonium]|uniref:Uncharacterized protein n=1 Tax=Datura stramonium TaxID=4076 RepID=A0ABS8WMQ2_DATST|nr:hypothetical protein [Datura stramonium]